MNVPAKVFNIKEVKNTEASDVESRQTILGHASNELILAVVGHVGSGTTEVAAALAALLAEKTASVTPPEIHQIKATEVIAAWARSVGKDVPEFDSKNKTLAQVEKFQDLGDQFREQTADHAAVAKGLAIRIRELRAQSQSVDPNEETSIIPDGTARAYILDSIRHPAEVELLRHIYQEAFVLVGVVCEEKTKLDRVTKKYKDSTQDTAMAFMRRDAKDTEKHGQRVSDAFHMADFFIDNTASRFKEDGHANDAWDVSDKLSRLIKILRHSEIVRPELSETAMAHAHSVSLRSACLSRQVGAALTDRNGNIVATGCNEVPKGGGGVYGDVFDSDHIDDHRCAYRKIEGHESPFCSNTKFQNDIIEKLIESVTSVKDLDESEKRQLSRNFRSSPVGALLEFSRAVHAEMDAIISAGRSGTSTVGCRLFVTTFPCHYCARHIVSAGIDEVQYIEPYPKSQALQLHADSIAIRAQGWTAPSVDLLSRLVEKDVDGAKTKKKAVKVLFRPFTGVAPRLYRRAFGKDRDLKNSGTGVVEVGAPEWGTPWHLRRMSYPQLESELATPNKGE